MQRTKWRSVGLKIMKIFMLIVITVIFFACSNPIITDLMDTIEDDVAVTLAGASPAVKSLTPGDGSLEISTSVVLTVEFDVNLDPQTVLSENAVLYRMPGETVISSTAAYNDELKSILVTPTSVLEKEVQYKLVISKNIKSNKGASLDNDIVINFTTRYFNDDEIGIDLSYSSNDLLLNSGAPIYIEFWPSPLEYPVDPNNMTVFTSHVITSSGKLSIPVSALPSGFTSGMFKFFHDLNGSYGTDSDSEDSADSIFWYNGSASGNLTSNADFFNMAIVPDAGSGSFFVDSGGTVIPMTGSTPDTLPAFYNLNSDFILTPGNGYSVQYSDGSPFAADPYETAEASNSYRELLHGTYENARNLHSLTDIDYFIFTPASSDVYEIRVKDTDFDITVGLYGSESDMFNASGALATPSSGTAARVINSGGTFLTGGVPYYIRIEGTSGGMGLYEIGYFYKPAVPDAAEDGDDVYGTAPTLTFGRDNFATRTIEAGWDMDYFAVNIPDNNWDFIVEVVEDPTYFNFSAESRNIVFDLSLKKPDGSGITTFGLDSNSMIIPATDEWNFPAGTYYIGVQNNSAVIGTESDQPSGQYKILITYSFDGADQANDPNSGINEYDNWNEHGPASYQASSYASIGTKGIGRTIYSVTEASPENDVDWISFRISNISSDYLLKIEPVSGADGVVVDYTIYRSSFNGSYNEPDTASIVTSSQQWADSSIRGSYFKLPYIANPTITEMTLWAKVTRDASYGGNPTTGAYKFYYMAGADENDDYYIDSANPDGIIDVYSGTYAEGNIVYSGGMDETPWIGDTTSDGGTNFSTRNELTWNNISGNADIDIHWRSLYRKNYTGNGEGDGVNAKGSDFDFFWFQVPDYPAEPVLPFNFVVYSRANYSVPLKISMWRITEAQFTTLSGDRYITEAELNSTDTPSYYYTSYNTGENVDKLEAVISTAEASALDYLFFKFELDGSRSTYIDGNGNTQNYETSGEYQIWIFE